MGIRNSIFTSTTTIFIQLVYSKINFFGHLRLKTSIIRFPGNSQHSGCDRFSAVLGVISSFGNIM